MQLLEGIKISANNGHSLSNNVKVVNIKSATKNTGSLWNNWFSYAMFLVIVVAINKRNIYLTYFTIVGILGIFLLVVGLISLHKELSLNINVLLFNPLMLFLVYFDLKNNRKLIRIFVNINLIFLVAYTIFMVNKVHLLMFLPLILTNYIFFIRILLKNKTA